MITVNQDVLEKRYVYLFSKIEIANRAIWGIEWSS